MSRSLITNLVDFNEEYKEYLEDRHYGLVIDNESVIEYLDKLFSQLIEQDIQFEYYQIKIKFGAARFYTSLPDALNEAIECRINSIIKRTEDNE